MATDPLTLLAQANCYACFGGGGTFELLEVSLYANWANSLNVVPAGAVYDGTSSYVVGRPPLVNANSYRVTLGPNEVSASIVTASGTVVISQPNFITFMAAVPSTITFTGVAPGLPVTASVVKINNLISAQFYSAVGQYSQAITVGARYTLTLFSPNDSIASSGSFSLLNTGQGKSWIADSATINFTGSNNAQVTAVLSTP